MKTLRILLVIITVVSLIQFTYGDDRVSLRSVGMGRSAVAASRGIDAIGVNPANIAIPDIGRFNMGLMNTSFRMSTELFSYDIYQKYFTGIDTGGTERAPYPLTQKEKEDIRSQLPESPLTRMNIQVMLAGLSFQSGIIGGIGYAAIHHMGMNIAFSRDYFDLLYLEGLPKNSKYIFDGTSFEAWWYLEHNISYGRKLPVKIPFLKDLYVGAGVKLISGYGIFQTTKNNSSLENKIATSDTGKNSVIGDFNFLATRAGVDFFNNGSDAPISPFPDPVGSGVGFDLGASAEFLNGIRLGFSVTDIGKITCEKNVLETSGGGIFTFSGYNKEIQDSVKEIFKGKNSTGESFTTSLPTVLRLGVSAQAQKFPFLKFLPGKLVLAVEYAQGLNESLGNTTKPRFSLGMEYRIIPLLPIRSGFLFGGGDKLRWAFGFGLDMRYFSLDFATDNFGMFFTPKSFNVFSLSLGMRIRV